MSASCGCALRYEECDEQAAVWSEARVGATRTEHKCCECGDPIPSGSRCCRASGLYEGKWSTWYRCVTCATLAEYVAAENKECPLWGCLSESCEYAGVSWHVFRTTGRLSLYESDEEEQA